MELTRRLIGLTIVLAAAAMPLRMTSAADAFPTRPVRIIVPTAPGSSPDLFARRLAEQLSRQWMQQVIIDNRPGAATSIGAQAAAVAAPDGYTLFYAPFNTLVVNPHLFKSPLYDPVRDFEPVTLAVKTSFALAMHASVPAKTFAELVAYGRKNPGALRFGSGGPGTPQHIFGELLNHETGIGATHVPYKSATPALADLVGGHIQFMFESFVTTQDQVRAGRLRYLAVTSRERRSELPDVPTLAELGVSDEDWTLWGGVVVPKGTSRERIAVLNCAIRAALKAPDFGEEFAGAQRVGSTPEEFQRFIASEMKKWKRLVEISGAKME